MKNHILYATHALLSWMTLIGGMLVDGMLASIVLLAASIFYGVLEWKDWKRICEDEEDEEYEEEEKEEGSEKS